jgi:Asp-tRNA(Asn)/Glu-tRNA(Gln) amidotransferase A subunit family amidase
MEELHLPINRQRFLACFSTAGLGSTLLPGALAAIAQDTEVVTIEMLEAAEQIAGIAFSRDEQERILGRLNGARSPLPAFDILRAAELGNDTQPAIVFNPVPPGKVLPTERRPLRRSEIAVPVPATEEDLAFLPVTHLSRLIETRQITSTELTEFYLARLKRYDPQLFCVVNLTEDLALRQARRADEEIAVGDYRGPLHGIPYGLKDLFAVRGTKTTWGMTPFRDRVIDVDATVYERLTEAGAVLIAKLSTGALAVSARWYGGLTRNPWNTDQDAAGSSAGPGAATAAGLVGFSIGTDTGGSVIGPSTRNGITGMRPTFGRVSRYGGMVLAWTQDTVGPMCRSAEDCALVFDAVYGPDGRDNSVLDVPFNWDATGDVSQLRVGYLRSMFEGDVLPDASGDLRRQRQNRRNAEAALRLIRSFGIDVVPFDLPDVDVETIDFLRYVETAAAFYDITMRGQLTDTEKGPERSQRPNEIRAAHFTPAVEYIQGNRQRMRIMQQMDEAMGDLDLFLGSDRLLTNRLGHPQVSLPSGFHEGTPTALHLTGKLFGEPEVLLLAHAIQAETEHHLQRPPL